MLLSKTVLSFQISWTILLCCAVLITTDVFAFDSSRKTGLGIVIGEPTGLSGKFWLDQAGQANAVDVGFAYSFGEFGILMGNYLMHKPGFFGLGSEFAKNLVAYYGAGGVLYFGASKKRNSAGLGFRVPFGAEWLAPSDPIGVGLEVAPGVRLVPDTNLILHIGLTFRYYF